MNETALLGNESLFTVLKEYATLINVLGLCILILMGILPIIVQYLTFSTQMLMLIFSVIIATLILQEKRTFAQGLMRKDGKP